MWNQTSKQTLTESVTNQVKSREINAFYQKTDVWCQNLDQATKLTNKNDEGLVSERDKEEAKAVVDGAEG